MWAPRSWRVKLAISMKTLWESERTQTAYFASLFAWILDKRHPLSGPWNIYNIYLAHTAVSWIFQCRLQSLCTTEYFSLKAHFYFEFFVCVSVFGCLNVWKLKLPLVVGVTVKRDSRASEPIWNEDQGQKRSSSALNLLKVQHVATDMNSFKSSRSVG